ncbi:hypothetical protein P152DRAFT_364392, partial [Eremomyces bilateralis CBS 781.70]
IASASYNKTVQVWCADTGDCVQTHNGYGDLVTSMAFSHNSVLITLAARDNIVRVWRANTCECIQTLESHGGSVTHHS